MPRAYSLDLRERALRTLAAGHTASEVAAFLGTRERPLWRWKARWVAGHPLTPQPSPGRAPKIGPVQHAALREQIAAHPDASLAHHVAQWQAATGVRVGIATMARTLVALGITRNNRPHGGRPR